MAFHQTISTFKKLLAKIQYTLIRAKKGNKAASQRTRSGMIKLAKMSKISSKESNAAIKQNDPQKPLAKKRKR